MLTVGRVPNTARLDIAGWETDQQAWIVADRYCKTSGENIYALGDVLGSNKIMLAHVESMEGRVAAENCLGKSEKMDWETIPSAVFTGLEIATVGLTETQAVEIAFAPCI